MVKFLELFFKFCVLLFVLTPAAGIVYFLKYGKSMDAMILKVVLPPINVGQILMICLPLLGVLGLAIISVVKDEIRKKTEKETQERLTLIFQKDCEEAFKKGAFTAEYSFLMQELTDKSQDLAGVLSLLPFSYGDRKQLYISETRTSIAGSAEFVFVLAGPDGVGTKVNFPGIYVSLDYADAIHSSDRGYEIGPIKFFQTDTPVKEFEGWETSTMSEQIERVKAILKRVEAILAGKAQPHSVVNSISNFGLRIEKRYIGQPPEIQIVVSPTHSIGPNPESDRANAESTAQALVEAYVDQVPPTNEELVSQYEQAKAKIPVPKTESPDGEKVSEESAEADVIPAATD